MIASKYVQVLYDVKVQIQNIMSLISMSSNSSSLIQVASNSTTEMMASCQVGLLMIGQIFASSSELECPIAHASHEVVDWAVTHCRAIHGCDSSSKVEWSKRVHTRQVEVVICGGVYGCVWWWHGVSWMGRPNYLHFTVNLCGKLAHFWRHYVMAVDGGSPGPLTFWSSFTSFHGLWQVPARQGEDRADLLGCSSIWTGIKAKMFSKVGNFTFEVGVCWRFCCLDFFCSFAWVWV